MSCRTWHNEMAVHLYDIHIRLHDCVLKSVTKLIVINGKKEKERKRKENFGIKKQNLEFSPK